MLKNGVFGVGSVLVALALAGCVAQNQMRTTHCLQEQQYSSRFNMGLGLVTIGMTKTQILANMGMPIRWESYLLEGGQQVEVMFYLDNAPSCGNNIEAHYTPMVFQNDKLFGFGETYYKAQVAPKVQNPLYPFRKPEEKAPDWTGIRY